MRKGPESPRPTLEELLIIRWGGDASSDLRRSARCTYCGSKRADLQHPSKDPAHSAGFACTSGGLAPTDVIAKR
jgi:hypothetical protein